MRIPTCVRSGPSGDFGTEYLGGAWDEIHVDCLVVFIPQVDPTIAGAIHMTYRTPGDYLERFYPAGEGPGAHLDALRDLRATRTPDIANAILDDLGTPCRIGSMPGDFSRWKALDPKLFGVTRCRTIRKRPRGSSLDCTFIAHATDGVISAEVIDRDVVRRNAL